MNWREFLKPNWKKIIVTIVLAVIIYLVAYIVFGARICTLEMYPVGQEPPGWQPCSTSFLESPLWFSLFWVINIIGSYIVSCLVFIKAALKKKEVI